MNISSEHNTSPNLPGGETGQASVLMVVTLTFLLASLGFAVDLVNMWFHRQSIQTAADAACLAGAMDMLDGVGGVSTPGKNFTVGTASNCVTSPTASICKYAGFNGFSGAGYTASTSGNSVAWTFPSASSVPGVTAPSSTITTTPFLQVSVTENIRTWFMSLVGIQYQAVTAASTCGLTPIRAAPPLVVLNPSVANALSLSGGPSVSVIGGPQRSMQVNSASNSAVYLGGSSTLDFTKAGPLGTGGDLGIVGADPSSSSYSGGTTGRWLSSVSPLPDPYAGVPAPAKPATCTQCSGTSVAHYWDGCPDSSGCTEYSPGYYPSGIKVKDTTAIFLPGLYYLGGDLTGDSNSILRNAWTYKSTVGPTPAPSTPADGVMFFLTGGAGMSFVSNSGSKTVDAVPSSYLVCNSGQTLPSGVPASLNGNVLWAQCTTNGTYDNYANTLVHSPDTESTTGSRGMLVYLDRTSTPPYNLSAGGGGSMAFAGTFYLHQANSYGDIFSLSGGSGTGTYVIGKIVTDELALGGNGGISMALSNDASVNIIKAALVQ